MIISLEDGVHGPEQVRLEPWFSPWRVGDASDGCFLRDGLHNEVDRGSYKAFPVFQECHIVVGGVSWVAIFL